VKQKGLFLYFFVIGEKRLHFHLKKNRKEVEKCFRAVVKIRRKDLTLEILFLAIVAKFIRCLKLHCRPLVLTERVSMEFLARRNHEIF